MEDEVLATFTINYQGRPQSGYITNMYDVHGNEVTEPHEAVEFLAFIQDSKTWIRFPADDDDVWTRVRIN